MEYEEPMTPHVKGSKRTTPKKGSGKGVCQVTGVKHEFLRVIFWSAPMCRKMFKWSRSAVHMVPHAEVCLDCMGYRNNWYLTGDSDKDVRRKVEDWAGEDWDNILVLNAKDLTDRVK